MLLDELTSVIDKVCESDPLTRADGEAIKHLHRELARLEAATTQSVAAFDASGDWQSDGARNAASWVAISCNVPASTAKRRLRLGRDLRHMPLAAAAWLLGRISASHVAALSRVRTPRTAEVFTRDEETLVDVAQTVRFGTFISTLRYWRYRADPGGGEQDAKDQVDERQVHLSQLAWGMWQGDMTLDPISGAIVSNELKRREHALFEADWAEAKARLGDDVCSADLRRTAAQRRADALVEIATRSAAMPADARRPEPLFSVYVGFETFAGPLCELANGTVVTPGSLVPWLNQAWIERAVFDGPRRVIDVGEQQRIFRGATRRAVALRDRECFHKFCDTPADDSQIDHVVPWAVGGPTVQANGRVACGFHNRLRHKRKP